MLNSFIVPFPQRGVKMEMDAIVIDKDNVLKAIVESKSSTIHLWQDLEKSSALVEFLGKITSDTGKITIALHGVSSNRTC